MIKDFKTFEHVSNIRIYTIDVMKTIDASPSKLFDTGNVVKFAAEFGTTVDYKDFEQEHYRVTAQHINLKTKEVARLNGGC